METKKIYELNMVKCNSTYITDRGAEYCNWKKQRDSRSYVEMFLDDQLFAGKTVYFEEKENAGKYISEFLTTLSNTTHIDYTNKKGEVIGNDINVLDIQIESTDYEDEVDKTSGTLQAIRMTIIDKNDNNYNLFKPIMVLTYEWEVKEKEVID